MEEPIPTPPSQNPEVPTQQQITPKAFHPGSIAATILSILVIALLGAVLFLLNSKGYIKLSSQKQGTNIQNPIINSPSSAGNFLPGGPQNSPTNQSPPPDNSGPETYVTASFLAAWKPIPPESGDQQAGATRFEIGTVTSGDYSGMKMYLEADEGLGTDWRHYVVSNGTKIYFDDKNIKIHGIDDLPDTIALQGTNYMLKKNWIANESFADAKLVKKLFTDSKIGDVYLDSSGCFMAELPDHTAITYNLVVPFVNNDTRTPEVTFNSGLDGVDPYTYTTIGCGQDCTPLAFTDESKLQPSARLTPAGTTSNGETMYQIKNSQDQVLLDLYNDKNTVPYYDQAYNQQDKSKYTYSEFISLHPLLYWKDPLGRWVEFKNDKFQVAAEMCKPVIYLYPSKATEMTVRVAPNGGFTYTNPSYYGGWHVVAYPDGTVKNISDGKQYPYLFWEGIGLNYPSHNYGFIVNVKDLDSFFNQKLDTLGLVGKEATDFKAYWIPRLSGLNKPFIELSFLTKAEIDDLAPLSLSVKPTTVIRVMLTAKGLDKFENIPNQELPQAPSRSSFTLVEWGGTVLH